MQKAIRIILSWLIMALGIISPLAASAATTASQKVLITPVTLRVRTVAGTDGAIIGYVGKGQKFDLLSQLDGWYEIEFEPGITGWILNKYTKLISAVVPTVSAATVPAASSMGTITVDLLKVRTGASASSAVIGYVGKDQTYPIIGKSKGWLKIKDEEGTMGWVLGTYVAVE